MTFHLRVTGRLPAGSSCQVCGFPLQMRIVLQHVKNCISQETKLLLFEKQVMLEAMGLDSRQLELKLKSENAAPCRYLWPRTQSRLEEEGMSEQRPSPGGLPASSVASCPLKPFSELFCAALWGGTPVLPLNVSFHRVHSEGHMCRPLKKVTVLSPFFKDC